MAPTKQKQASPNTFDGGIADLLQSNLTDGKRKQGKRSFLLPTDPNERIVDVINDDELEKKKRQEEAKLLEKERTEKARSTAPKAFNLLSNLSPAELEEHYTQCIRMCNQNKVNPKNAFKLQLIDYMKLILLTQNKKTENLSLMSCTLDASAKIYSCRVDKVYSDMMTIMSGKVWKDEESNTEVDENEERGEDEEFVPRKKKKSDKGDKHDNVDLEKMLWSETRLDKSEAELESSTSLNYVRTVLPSNAEFFLDCPMSDSDGNLSLNSQLFEAAEINSSDNILKDFVTKYTGSLDSMDPAKALPGYLDMYQDKSDVSVLVNKNLVYDKDSHLMPDSIRLEVDDVADNVDNDGQPMIDYDDCLSDEEGVEPTPLSSQNTTKIGQLSVPRASFSVNSMSKLVTARRSEYSFFDNSRLNFMAGPSHWSIKNKKNKLTKSSDVPKSTKKEGSADFGLRKVSKIRKLFSETVKVQLSSKTMKLWCRTNHSIPVNIYYQRDIVSLIRDNNLIYITNDFKYGLYEGDEQSKIKDLNQSLTPEDFIDHGERDDGGDLCDDARDDDDDDDDDNHQNGERIPTPTTELTNEAENGTTMELVPAPPKVNKIVIKYAKAQKRIDIKLLKATIWDYLDLDKTKKNGLETENEEFSKKSGNDKQQVEVKLSDVYNSLPGKLPQEETAQLSFPLVFMAILHMANEKTLKLVGNEHYSDVTICRG